MPRKETFVNFTELVSHAKSLGYGWNDACDILNDLRPQYELRSLKLIREDFTDPNSIIDYGYDADVVKIMLDYFDSVKKDTITVLDE